MRRDFKLMGRNDGIPLLIFLVSAFGLDSLCRRNGSLGRHLNDLLSVVERRNPEGGADDWNNTSLKLCF